MEHCLVCNSSNSRKYLTVKGFTYYVCNACAAVFLPGVTYTEQAENHMGSDYKNSRIRVDGTHILHNKWLINSMLSMKSHGSVLDVGCGAGYLVKEMCDIGYLAQGIDLGPENVEFAREKLGVTVLNQDFFVTSKQYDIISMHQVIEHVPNPSEFIQKCHELLPSDGLLILSTPNLTLAKILAKLPKPFLGDALGHPPNHCVLFEKKTIVWLLEQNGFRMIKIVNNPTGLKTPSKLRHILDLMAEKSNIVGLNMLVYAKPS